MPSSGFVVKMPRVIPLLSEMTLEQFSRQTYWYPILWFVFATGVAFAAAILFWQRGSSSAGGKIPGLPVTWKFTGAGAVFVVVLLVFFVINPIKGFSDYKKIVIVFSNQDVASPTGVPIPLKITQADLATKSISFDPDSLQIELVPYDSIYVLRRAFDDKSFVTSSPIPKGTYRIRLVSSKTGDSQDFMEEVK